MNNATEAEASPGSDLHCSDVSFINRSPGENVACCPRHHRRLTRAWELALLLRLSYGPCIRCHKSYHTFGVKKHVRAFSSSLLWLTPPSKWTSSINPTSAATERSGPLETAQRGSSLGLEDCPFHSAKQQMPSTRAGNDAFSPGSPS